MEDVLPPYHVFINHRGPDVKNTLASIIYQFLDMHGLRVFLDKQELQVGDPFPPAIKSAIRSASVHIAIFSETYAQSPWCLDELVWMFGSESTSTKIIPIFYDIDPSDLRHVEKGPYATAFEQHRKKKRYSNEQIESWKDALGKVSDISGVVFRTKTDDHGSRLKEIVEIVLEKVGRGKLHVCEYPVGLLEAAEHFEKEVLNRNELNGTHVVGIVGLGGSGKSTLVTYLYNSMRSRFQRSCFLSEVSKNNLPSLQETLLRNLLRDPKLNIENTRIGKSRLQGDLRGLTRVLIVFDDIDNAEQTENLLFVKDVLGSGSLILVTSRNQSLFVSSTMEIYNMRLLDTKHARELFCCHAFGNTKPLDEFQEMADKLVIMCGGFPLALKVLAGKFHNERDPRMWKKQLESFQKQVPTDPLKQVIMDSYESLDVREKKAFLDVAHFLIGEDRDLAERILDGLLDESGFQFLQTLRHKCLLEIEFVDIIRPRALQVESKNRNVGVWRRAKGSFKIRMHDLVRDLARQIGRHEELPLRLCCSNDRMISSRVSGSHGSVGRYDVRGIRRDADHSLPEFLHDKDIYGLQLLAVHNFNILREFKCVSGELTWIRLGHFDDILYPSPVSLSSLRKFPSLSLRSLRVLEVHGVSPQNFRNLFDDCEPPQLCALEVTCTTDLGSVSGAGPSTSISIKQGSASETSDSSQLRIDHGLWFLEWLGKVKWIDSFYKLVLQYIGGLKTLPIKFEQVRNLKHVDLSGCSDLECLPDSFTKELSQLQYLALRDCRKLVLRDLGKISTLEYLDFEGCSVLTELPKGTEVQKSLKHLNVLRTGLTKLPHNLEQLEDLEELLIGSSGLTEIPSSLYNLSRLTVLTLLGCSNLHSIDNSIEKLVHLESFRMYNCGVKALPEKIAWLNMKILDVQVCPLDSEQILTGVDPGNMPLDSSQPQGSICQSAYPNRTGLTDLIIRGTDICKIDIPQAESLFPKLEIVDLSNNSHLIEIGRLPRNLISLNLTNCSFLGKLACLSNLVRLKVLDITGCGEISSLNVEGLRSIQVINANGCWQLCDFQGIDAIWEQLSCFQISRVLQFQMTDMFCHIMTEGAEMPGGRVLKELKYSKEASVEIKKCYFTDDRPNRAILLFLLADPKCQIEVEFLGHTYTTHYSYDHSGHILMWSKDSDVFNDFKFSNDEAVQFNFKVLNSPSREQVGWIVEILCGHSCLNCLKLVSTPVWMHSGNIAWKQVPEFS